MNVVDLSHPIESGMPVYPGDPPVDLRDGTTFDEDGYRVSRLTMSTHAGTHLDAPSHTEPHGSTIDDLPIERFVFDARLVDCTGADVREPIHADDLPNDDAGDLVVCHTGWDAHWGDERYLDHPYLTAGATQRCVDADWGVGLDTPSPDPTPTDGTSSDEPSGFPVHRTLLGNELSILENLTNLDALETARFTLYAFPLSLSSGDGAPVRAVAHSPP